VALGVMRHELLWLSIDWDLGGRGELKSCQTFVSKVLTELQLKFANPICAPLRGPL
jgi:hypothetical protein